MSDDLKKEIGMRIKECRKAKHITQAELAKAIGVAEITVRQYEAGRFEPDIKKKVAIASVLKTPYDHLFTPSIAFATDTNASAIDAINKQEIGTRIKQYREEKGLTQRRLGEKVGCHEGTIRQYENGLREPKKVSRLAIARALDVPYDRLFPQYGDYAPDTNVATKLSTNLASLGTDCISREQAIEALGELATFTEDWSCHTWMYTDDVYNAIKQLPPIQPKRGRWLKLDMHIGMADHKCTACEQECYVPTCMGEPMYAFCPNCGAKMEVNHESN